MIPRDTCSTPISSYRFQWEHIADRDPHPLLDLSLASEKTSHPLHRKRLSKPETVIFQRKKKTETAVLVSRKLDLHGCTLSAVKSARVGLSIPILISDR